MIYLLRLSVVQGGMSGYWKGKEWNGWTLGIPCILETARVSHETTWEMRVCKQMVYDNIYLFQFSRRSEVQSLLMILRVTISVKRALIPSVRRHGDAIGDHRDTEI